MNRIVRVASLVGISITAGGCGGSGTAVPPQSPDAVAATLADALTACNAPLLPTGAFDQGAITAAGWRESRRITRVDTTERTHPAGTQPVLRAGEYEATDWVHAAHSGTLTVIRWDHLAPDGPMDQCSINARVAAPAAVADLVPGLTLRLRRPVAQEGDLPRGGDFLTPRSDKASHAWHWELPQHAVSLVDQGAGAARLEVEAVVDRGRGPLEEDALAGVNRP